MSRENSNGQPTGGPELRERIARLYEAHPEGAAAKEDRRGAKQAVGVSWVAARLHRSPRTIQRWIDGTRTPDPLALAVISDLEREAGL